MNGDLSCCFENLEVRKIVLLGMLCKDGKVKGFIRKPFRILSYRECVVALTKAETNSFQL